jgi:hypothetical protein
MRKVEVIGFKIAKETYHEFESLTHAAEHCKAAVESIYLVCQGKFKQTKGWCFVYKSENFAEEIQSKLSQQTTRGKSSCKKVKVTDTYGGVEIYDSGSEAASLLGVSRTTIAQCANGKRNHSSFTFKFI